MKKGVRELGKGLSYSRSVPLESEAPDKRHREGG